MIERPPITVALVDDHVLFRDGIQEILENEPDITVVGGIGDSEGAVELVTRTRPDVVLLDVEIIGDEVTTTVQRLRRLVPETRIVILSMYDGPHLVQPLLAIGIRGYLLKTASREELVSAVRSVYVDDGRIILGVSRESLAQLNAGNRDGAGPLSQRERDVLQLVAQALSNSQIARRLLLTETTVKRHLSNIFAKLGAVSRIDAVNKAIAASIIDPPRPTHHPQAAQQMDSHD
jgi:DNA-binding NarL/FixJ family response regulator